MKNNTLLLAGAVGLFAVGLYMYSKPAPPPGYGGYGYVPPGGTYNGFYNSGNQPAWVGITNGVFNVVGQLGQILATMPWNGSGSGGGSTLPNSNTGYYADNGEGSISWYPY